MTIEEAIKHCEEIADDESRFYNQEGFSSITAKHCKCAEEHRQLAKWLKELKALKAQGLRSACTEVAQDTVSRRAVLDAFEKCHKKCCHEDKMGDEWIHYETALNEIKCVPSAERKTGHWKGCGFGDYMCSLCNGEVFGNSFNYCPHCGCKMEVDDE